MTRPGTRASKAIGTPTRYAAGKKKCTVRGRHFSMNRNRCKAANDTP
jgi:hypothetical protein